MIAASAGMRVLARINYHESDVQVLITNVMLGEELMASHIPQMMMQSLLDETSRPITLAANAGPDARRWWAAAGALVPPARYHAPEGVFL